MRDFFIKGFEAILAVILIFLALGVVFVGATAAAQQGPLMGLAIVVGGAIYVLFLGGMTYLFVGVYHNTRRTAEAVERLAEAQTFK